MFDFIDVIPRQETLPAVSGHPVLLQLPLVPCYALTVHKVQSLSMTDIVRGCLEGVFAQGQVYVLASRVTDPRNLQLIGIPPADLLEDVASAWQAAGLDVVECLRRATQITQEWVYTPGYGPLRDRLQPKRIEERRIPPVLRELSLLRPFPPPLQEQRHLLQERRA